MAAEESAVGALPASVHATFDRERDWRAAFRTHWRDTVPAIYTPRANSRFYNPVVDETAVRGQLLDVLDNFIFDKAHADALKQLSHTEKPPTLCGRVFKNGEPTYSCRDCGMDPTCVLCVDCFKTSEHRNHRYKMSTSGGGGFCDCGDHEAWKSAACCDLHASAEATATAEESPLDRLPPVVLAKARTLIDVCLEYCFEMLTWENFKSTELPDDLKPPPPPSPESGEPSPELYVTMLFNDEVHTYEEVIRSLEKSIDCSKKEATDYATAVDREGRCIVRCAPFSVCNHVKEKVERITSHRSPNPKPLRVIVMNVNLVAHQSFALRLLSWLHQLIAPTSQPSAGFAATQRPATESAFRLLFSECVTRPRLSTDPHDSEPRHILKGIMEFDTRLWKTARSQWHQLLITGLLLESSSKREFARAFAKNYPELLADFVADDHDHVLSITSLSVQIFTVPTLAHMLIAEDNVLTTLLVTFNRECQPKLNADGRLAFERHHHAPHSSSGNGFRRAQFVLCDLRYLLISKPENWSVALRRNFLHGFEKLLELLTYMQGMDATVRQLGQHMEFEPEWESAFHLYIRLSYVLTLATEWCGSNRDVLIRAYKSTLRHLAKVHPRPVASGATVVHEVAGKSVTCVVHDVSSQPVSIHLPLSRLVAALHLHLERYELSYSSPEFSFADLPTPAMLVEMPLRALAMIAQVHAGMWRRNGYSVVNQIYFYQNVKCRQEMYDRDVVMLQAGAALMGGDEFVARVLHKFGLTAWAREGYETEPAAAGIRGTAADPEDGCRQVITLVEEFLGLLLVVVGERHVPGVGRVTEDDRVRKEIIQQLCIEPMAHSQLTKTLPEDCNHETGLETVIDQVATFRKPASGVSGKGLYVLKPELYAEYNPFFYHYSREEQSRAEETQRRRKKAAYEEECCPPPIPPPLCDTFAPLTDVLLCDVTLHVIRLVLERCLNLRARTFSEMIFQKLLHLIGYALHEERRALDDRHTGRPLFDFTRRATDANILPLMELLASGHQRIASHKDLLNHTIRRFKQQRQQSLAAGGTTETSSLSSTRPNFHQEGGVPMEVTEEDSALTTITSASDQPEDEAAAVRAVKEEKRRRAEMAAARRARILEQMQQMQKSFIREHADLFEKETGLTKSGGSALSGSAMDLSEQSGMVAEINSVAVVDSDSPVCLGPHKSVRQWITNRHTCILCQEDQAVSPDGRPLVLSALVQKSTVLSKRRGRLIRNPDEHDPLLPSGDLYCAPHTSTCGHVMHADCWQKYFESVLAKERRRSLRMRYHLSFDVDKQEFLCPLCECLSNTVIPIVPVLGTLVSDLADDKVVISMDDWLSILEIAIDKAKVIQHTAPAADPDVPNLAPEPPKQTVEPCTIEDLCQHVSDPALVAGITKLYMEPSDSDSELKFSTSLTEMMKLFSQATYTIGLGVHPHLENERMPLMTWQSCAHTIITIENLLRDSGKPLFGNLTSRQSDCLSVLVRFAGTCASQVSRSSVLHTHCHRLVRKLLHADFGVCSVDAFGYLVALVLSLPHLVARRTWTVSCGVPIGGVQELLALTLLYAVHVVQILITLPPEDVLSSGSNDEAMEAEEAEDDGQSRDADTFDLLAIYLHIQKLELGVPGAAIGVPKLTTIERLVKERSIPFLRCCALFFHNLTGIKAPETLTNLPSDEYDTCRVQDEYGSLCQYLGMPSDFSTIVGSSRLRTLIYKWLSNPVLAKAAVVKTLWNVRFPHEVNHLWSLPADYSELINVASLFTCPNSEGEDSRAPAMCLVCGAMLCSQSYCCQSELDGILVGACTHHAHYCGAGVGMFLRVRECKIVLLASKMKGCFIAPPYLDQYGETDQGLKRGNPLQISHENYKKLHKLWLSHGIPEEIAHSLETNAQMTSAEWQIF